MKRILLFLLLISCAFVSCNRYASYRHYNDRKLNLVKVPKKGEQTVSRKPVKKKSTIKPVIDTTTRFYEEAYLEMKSMLEGSDLSFKRAVFLTENAYWNNELDYEKFCAQIRELSYLCEAIMKSRELAYNGDDKNIVKKHAAIFSLLTDTLRIAYGNDVLDYPAFRYDFEDFSGSDDWTKMFVTRLISSHKGNCHSFPFLYKILAEEIGEDAYLSLAPNHIYIKLNNKQNGWYNTELTSGVFPIDAWLMASGYIHTDAIRNGIYMDTLGQKQSIAVCMTDLAQGYARKYGKDSSEFVLKACNAALRYYPNYINAFLLRAETQKHRIEKLIETKQIPYAELKTHPETQVLFDQLKSDYTRIHELGYRKMPDAMYMDWLLSLTQEKSKYDNKKISTFNPGTH